MKLASPYQFAADFTVTQAEYGPEELYFQHCWLKGIRCLIMRPSSHNSGAAHGPAHLELMSTVWLRKECALNDGDLVAVLVGTPGSGEAIDAA